MDIITFEKECTIQSLTYQEIDILIACLDEALDTGALYDMEDSARIMFDKLVEMHRPDRKSPKEKEIKEGEM